MFRVASQNRIFQDIVGQIQEAILDGRLQAGDTLPSEREMKTMFDTSRGTLREALRVLEERGLIDIKLGVGGGSVVKAVGVDKVSESLALLIRTQRVSLKHLAEFRESVEGVIIARAAERATPEDIGKLEALLEEAGKHIGRGTAGRDKFIDIDKQIHLVLAEITGNPMGLAQALQRLEATAHRIPMQVNPAGAQLAIVNPLAGGKGMLSLFRTHPPTEDRVARLQEIAAGRGA